MKNIEEVFLFISFGFLQGFGIVSSRPRMYGNWGELCWHVKNYVDMWI